MSSTSLRKNTGAKVEWKISLGPASSVTFTRGSDTTGIEPNIALVKYKLLAGGGMLKIVNRTVSEALRGLRYVPEEIDHVIGHIEPPPCRKKWNNCASTWGNRCVAGCRRRAHPSVTSSALQDTRVTSPSGCLKMAARESCLSPWQEFPRRGATPRTARSKGRRDTDSALGGLFQPFLQFSPADRFSAAPLGDQ